LRFGEYPSGIKSHHYLIVVRPLLRIKCMETKVGKSVIQRTPRRAEALRDGPSPSFGPNRYSRRAHHLGGEKRTPSGEEARKSGEEAT
jgi:hypothetical protein